MPNSDDSVLDKIDRYYTDRLREHGATPRGVDWNSSEAQEIRFAQLFKLLDHDAPLVLDYGCGYGAFAQYLFDRYPNARYVGFDISEAMIDAARLLYGEDDRCSFTSDRTSLQPVSFVVASGIFSVKMDVETPIWERYISDTVQSMASLAKRGIAFNLLTAYSDASKMRPDLYYADPHRYFDFVRVELTRNVAILHDYGLYEFTLHARH